MGEYEYIDYLTGLHNRQGVNDYLDGLYEDQIVHYMFLDLDNFKTVNDVYGHQAGDQALILFADILNQCVRNAIIARMGGDEFVIVITGEKKKEELKSIASHIIRMVKEEGQKHVLLSFVTVSIGIVWNFSCEEKREALMVNSDSAMYEAKRRGKNCFVFYDEIEERVNRERDMGLQAREAMDPQQFEFYFRGYMNLQSAIIEKTEVEVEWHANNNTVWTAEDFRPLMEKMGVIRQVDLIIFEKLCQEIQDYRPRNVNNKTLCIELCHLLFLDDNLGKILKEIMTPYGLDPRDFELGIDETAFNNRDAGKLLSNLNRLVEEGFLLTLCHFGKDFSGIRYLRDLPIQSIEFDQRFLKENLENHRGRKIIKSMMKLGKDLKMTVSAIGITEKKEVEYLSQFGCNAAFGDFYGRPMKLEDYVVYAKKIMADHRYSITYPFIWDLCSDTGNLPGIMRGEGITFDKGISDLWGSVYFPGGNTNSNVVIFPKELLSSDNYTISMWIKPEDVTPWSSVIYMRYVGGFASLIPMTEDGMSIFRINEDENVDVWHDVCCRAVEKNEWYMLTVTYNAFSETSVYYINGRKAGKLLNVPTLLNCQKIVLGGDPFQKAFQGWVCALMVFEAVKTEEEVGELYQKFADEPGFMGSVDTYWCEKEE